MSDLPHEPTTDATQTQVPGHLDTAQHQRVLDATRDHPIDIGPYHIISPIAEGGMGVVYKADWVYGDGGNDFVYGRQGNDHLFGGAGNDNMHGLDGNDEVVGDAGMDNLWGGPGRDALRGGSEIDNLFGDAGNDDLYGGSGDDDLLGGDGNDGLFGGVGGDDLYGQADADRFLFQTGDMVGDQTQADARINFANGTTTLTDADGVAMPPQNWTDFEIERIDAALEAQHRTVGTTRLLKRSNGSSMTIERHGGTGRGWNDGTRIVLSNAQFNGGDNWLRGYVLHEIGHYWNGTQIGATNWQNFRNAGNWNPAQPNPNAQFASTYARTNANEDFAESFSAYFAQRAGWAFYNNDVPTGTPFGATAIPVKIGIFDQWVFG